MVVSGIRKDLSGLKELQKDRKKELINGIVTGIGKYSLKILTDFNKLLRECQGITGHGLDNFSRFSLSVDAKGHSTIRDTVTLGEE